MTMLQCRRDTHTHRRRRARVSCTANRVCTHAPSANSRKSDKTRKRLFCARPPRSAAGAPSSAASRGHEQHPRGRCGGSRARRCGYVCVAAAAAGAAHLFGAARGRTRARLVRVPRVARHDGCAGAVDAADRVGAGCFWGRRVARRGEALPCRVARKVSSKSWTSRSVASR